MKETKEERRIVLQFRWTVSRGRDTYGYNICTLYADGTRVARCNGGGYDMKGTVLGNFIAANFAERLRRRISGDPQPCDYCEGRGHYPNSDGTAIPCHRCDGKGTRAPEYYGLSFHDPDYDPGKAVITTGFGGDSLEKPMTVEEAEAAGESLGLDRYQAFYSASSKFPDELHRVPLINGACGFSSVERIAEAIGLKVEYITDGPRDSSTYVLHVGPREEGELK